MKSVFLARPSLIYPKRAPFDPSEAFPELLRGGLDRVGDNQVHGALRELFLAAGFDAEHAGTPEWNPLGGLISPGDRVVLKPNWVFDVRGREEFRDQLTTHGAVVRAILDYVVLALRGSGVVSIGDVPLQSADFAGILADNGIEEILASYRLPATLRIEVLDLRRERVELDSSLSKVIAREKLPGDPLGYTELDLGRRSYLQAICDHNPRARFAVGDYDENITNSNQKDGVHRYLFPNTILAADVFINLPKMKTHRKTGITGALKNLIGINGSKAYLVHYTKGGPRSGGDEFERYNFLTGLAGFTDQKLKPLIPTPVWGQMRRVWSAYKKRVLRQQQSEHQLLTSGGGWYGNQTLWRTIYDINTLLFFADRSGQIKDTPQRRYLALVDGIVTAEGEGPLFGSTRHDGTLILGDDPIDVDACMALRMGFDPSRIPSIHRYTELRSDLCFSTYDGHRDFRAVGASPPPRPFVPSIGWRGHIEG
jgi:uncharacterized protein (DUF362 family)